MKRVAWFSILALGALVLLASGSLPQNKAQQAALAGPDSTQKICKEMYVKNCSGCHGEKGQGIVGPNLADTYWLHGGGTQHIAKTIKEGVSGKGMISWDAVLSAAEIEQMSDYVIAFQGTDPPKAKKPEGEPREERRN